jgi:hypothetical protein
LEAAICAVWQEPKLEHDSSTSSLIRRYRKYKETA